MYHSMKYMIKGRPWSDDGLYSQMADSLVFTVELDVIDVSVKISLIL